MLVAHPILLPFLDYLKFEKRYSRHTFISYQNDLTSFLDYCIVQYEENKLKALSHIIIRSWLAGLKEEGLSSKSINRKISTLRSFFKYQVRTGAIEQTPMIKIIAQKTEKNLPHFVAEKDIATLSNYVEFGDDWVGKTDRLLMMVFYNTGMRLTELINLKQNQVNSANHTIKVLGKGNKERIIPVSKEIISQIENYISDKQKFNINNTEHLLTTEKGIALAPRTVYNKVKKYLTLVTTIDKRSPHVMRHTFATHLMNNGADLNAVKELLGHSSLASTQVYTHNTIDKLKNIHKKAHPRA